MPLSRTPDPFSVRSFALFATFLVVGSLLVATAPVAAQSSGGDGSTAGGTDTNERRCFPDGGHDLTIGDGNPHINVTVHTSLFTNPAPPSALGLAAEGVAVGSEIIELRTGVVFEGDPETVSASGVWDSFVILFDYRFSLPMFSDSIDDSTYEPSDGPVSGVDTRDC
ncbi:DUF7332 family protein [Halobellus inordinatus]|uniref:DUF7332 family protein n=1 Tax=Halobellus inordinatus TaxID=1126236 RepID=UPI0021156472|nr:hypothetical protein [Halobellus ramosii]